MACDTELPSVETLPPLLRRLRSTFDSGRTRSITWRREQLRALRALLCERADDIAHALWLDLRKPRFEADVSEAGLVQCEIDFALANLSKWMKPRRAHVPLIGQFGHAKVVPEPLGMVLIIGAWNYPINLMLAPLVGALAGGNVVTLKPSEVAPATSSVIESLIPEYLDSNAIAVVPGGHETALALVDEKFDHLFFTGSSRAARAILERAAPHLTPVTLELGGRSPCLVDRHVDLKVAARRIAWGKFLNAGQTCVAPDHVLVHEDVAEELIDRMCQAVREFYGEDPQRSPDYGRIVNDCHFRRLSRFLGDGEIVCGGVSDREDLYIAPTILDVVNADSPVMHEEIFGPILPVLTVRNMEEAIGCVNAMPQPLVLYLFSLNGAVQEAVVNRTQSGSVCINDVVLQLAIPDLPFGGVGASGMGRYHGRFSFETFTRPRGVLAKSFKFDLPLRYPPYSDAKARWIQRLS